ncbi:hypothetical protein MGU_08098 [Metarhizium guizhouense ARSEF 977]|uniref:TLC domain-containing protein n=1 Tax=Metarhizium guizhouense (strain ARSEF 977) TaxID=1276136 RepID=A0A0B4GQ62_METGA|nr:hypothetical protein MGU_08098 [Metarhizium guizhouense ARSEF 977]
MHQHAGSHGPHLAQLVNQLVSQIAPFSGLILTIAACILAAIRIYLLDLVVIPKFYSPRVLKDLTDAQLRSFVNHHVAAGSKILLIIVTAYPLLAILVGYGTPHTPFSPGSSTTLGDVLIVSSQIFTVMYIFELFYRDNISPISFAHHVGAIIIAQSAIAMSIDFDHQSDAVYEFILCFIWGTFDVLAELWPHIAMIIYRTHNSKHGLLSRLFYTTMALELVGTTVETVVVMWLFGSLWDKWSLSLKIVTPFLHFLFSAAQLWGAWIFYKLAKDQRLRHVQGAKNS